jgi:uncharacterized membrane protein
LINRAMEYDEAYTFSEFARHSLRQVITDYHVPNNHVFHTILVHFSYLLFGKSPWAIRLPAFLAGLVLVPAVYGLGRQNYPVPVSLAAVAGVAVFPVLVFYSVNARGYTLICLWTVLLLLLSEYVRRRRNPAGWAAMVLVTALGFYTIPIMLYPFAIALAWLFLSGVFRDISPEYHGLRAWLAHLAGFSVCAALLTVFLYTPIFRSNGILTVFKGNTVVNPRSAADFWGQLPLWFQGALGELQTGNVPVWVFALTLAGVACSLVLHRRMARQRVPVQAAALLVVVLTLVFQRPLILARVWLFLMPPLVLWGAAGLLGMASLLRLAPLRLRLVQNAAAALVLAALLWGGGRFIAPYLVHPDLVRYPSWIDAELVTRYLKDHLREGDVVVVSNDEDAQYWYYFDAYQIPEVHIRGIKSRPFTRALIISHTNPHRTVESVILQFGPDPGFFRMDTQKTVAQIRNTVIIEILPYQDIVDRAYGVKK